MSFNTGWYPTAKKEEIIPRTRKGSDREREI